MQTFKASKSNVLENSTRGEDYFKLGIGTKKFYQGSFLLIAPALIVLWIRVFHLASGGLANLCPKKVTHDA